MRNTIARLKSIFSANLNFFISSSVITAIAYGIFFVTIAHLKSETKIDDFSLTRSWELIFVSLIFLLPIVSYVSFHFSNLTSGVKSSVINAQTTKRNLFLATGILWASLGCSMLGLIAGSTDYVVFVAATTSLLAWYFIFKLLTKYVFTL
jgi:hypothetical protein